jgi:hypothetical protein
MTWEWAEKEFIVYLEEVMREALVNSVTPLDIESVEGNTVIFTAGGPAEGYWSEPPKEAARFEVTIRKVE